ncbi:thioredoxin family protein [Magnetococcales bacterium HHB-1]
MVLLHTPPGELGASAEDFTLPGVDGKEHTLAEYQESRVLVIMFTCNHCPYVQSVEGRLFALARELKPLGVSLVAINSNDPTSYPEDSFEKMVERAEKLGYPFDYLCDVEQDVARRYGAVCTPDFFVYDKDRKLRYRGRLDDSPRQPSAVQNQEMREAILAILEGRPVTDTQHASMGCSIKWKNDR